MFDTPIGQSDIIGISCGRTAVGTDMQKQGVRAEPLRSGRFPLDTGSIDRFVGAS